MRDYCRSSIFAWFILLLVATVSLSQAQNSNRSPSKIDGHTPRKYSADTILVKPLKHVATRQLEKTHGTIGSKATHTFQWIGNLQIVKLPKGKSVEEAIKQYQASGLVEYAEPDYEV